MILSLPLKIIFFNKKSEINEMQPTEIHSKHSNLLSSVDCKKNLRAIELIPIDIQTDYLPTYFGK